MKKVKNSFAPNARKVTLFTGETLTYVDGCYIDGVLWVEGKEDNNPYPRWVRCDEIQSWDTSINTNIGAANG